MCILETAEGSSRMDMTSYNQLPNHALCVHMQGNNEPDQGICHMKYGQPKYNLWQFLISMNTVTNLGRKLIVSTGQSDHTLCCQGPLLFIGEWKYLLLQK